MSTPTPRTDVIWESHLKGFATGHETKEAIEKLERELAEANRRAAENLAALHRFADEIEKGDKELTAHKAALEMADSAIKKVVMLCENGMGCVPDNRPKWITDALAAIAKLKSDPTPKLARNQPCGCVVCICKDEIQCHGCGAKNCGKPDCQVRANPKTED